jgi:hypothetical protein
MDGQNITTSPQNDYPKYAIRYYQEVDIKLLVIKTII